MTTTAKKIPAKAKSVSKAEATHQALAEAQQKLHALTLQLDDDEMALVDLEGDALSDDTITGAQIAAAKEQVSLTERRLKAAKAAATKAESRLIATDLSLADTVGATLASLYTEPFGVPVTVTNDPSEPEQVPAVVVVQTKVSDWSSRTGLHKGELEIRYLRTALHARLSEDTIIDSLREDGANIRHSMLSRTTTRKAEIGGGIVVDTMRLQVQALMPMGPRIANTSIPSTADLSSLPLTATQHLLRAAVKPEDVPGMTTLASSRKISEFDELDAAMVEVQRGKASIVDDTITDSQRVLTAQVSLRVLRGLAQANRAKDEIAAEMVGVPVSAGGRVQSADHLKTVPLGQNGISEMVFTLTLISEAV